MNGIYCSYVQCCAFKRKRGNAMFDAMKVKNECVEWMVRKLSLVRLIESKTEK